METAAVDPPKRPVQFVSLRVIGHPRIRGGLEVLRKIGSTQELYRLEVLTATDGAGAPRLAELGLILTGSDLRAIVRSARAEGWTLDA